jgi:hypothetical protein
MGRVSPGDERQVRRPHATYYVIKYLGLTCTVAFILALVNLWNWPPVGDHARKGLVFLGISLACIFATKHRLLVLCMPLGIVALRGVISASLGVHPILSLVIAAIAGSALWFVVRKTARDDEDIPIPKGYSLREVGLDILIMGPVIALIYLLDNRVL